MFLVGDTLDIREEKIRSFLPEEPFIAVLLAAAHFEWTIRRAIILLSKKPNKTTREELKKCSGLSAYKDVWKNLVKPNYRVSLPELVRNWEFFKKEAFPLRHRLIHGVKATVGKNYGLERAECILGASHAIAEFVKEQGYNVFSRLKVRRK